VILNDKYTLSNGVEIPKLGLGTWLVSDNIAGQAVKDAVRLGYRHIDTAQAYGNENGVGVGIRTCGVNRQELFITTKLAAEVKSYKQALSAIDESLLKLRLEYVNLMIIHSPQPWKQFGEKERFFEGNREAWRALEEAHKAGKLRAIGLSNFQKPGRLPRWETLSLCRHGKAHRLGRRVRVRKTQRRVGVPGIQCRPVR